VWHLAWVFAVLLGLDGSHTLHSTGVAQGLGSIWPLTPLWGARCATLHACLDLACARLCLLLVLLGLAGAPWGRAKGEGRVARMLFQVTVTALHLCGLHFSVEAAGKKVQKACVRRLAERTRKMRTSDTENQVAP
jgi:hypothetical protein